MSTALLSRTAAAAVLASALSAAAPATADQPGQPLTTSSTPAKADSPTDNALRRGGVPPAVAARADRGYCRDQAAKRKLFGLGRHKFLQRCRKERRKTHPR